MGKKFTSTTVISAAIVSLGLLLGFASTASASEGSATASAAERAQVPFKPGGLVLVSINGEFQLGHFIGVASDDPDFVEVALRGEGRATVPLTDVIPLPGPGNSSGGN